MMISYDYTEFISELEGDIRAGFLLEDETVQILRSSEQYYNYRPIIDWYFSEKRMKDILKADESYPFESKDNLFKMKLQYEKDKPYLEVMSVKNFLKEIREMNKIIK